MWNDHDLDFRHEAVCHAIKKSWNINRHLKHFHGGCSFPLIGTGLSGVNENVLCFRSAAAFLVMRTCPPAATLHNRAAMFTVSPMTVKSIRSSLPIAPVMTLPALMPIPHYILERPGIVLCAMDC